jgi:Uma2 family endonuclease
MSVGTHLVTAEDLLRMPDDGWRYELVRGELRRMPLPGFRHGRIANRIGHHLTTHVQDHDLGVVVAAETGFLLHSDPDEVRGADVAFVSKARLQATNFSQEKHFPGAPDLAVEIVSPSDSYADVEEKVLLWLGAGAQLIVVADPKKQVLLVHRPNRSAEILTLSDTLDATPVVPGWVFRVSDAFPAE